MSNYPDDIRMYDDDPRSPFYEEPAVETCLICEEPINHCTCGDEYYEDI